MNNNVTETVLKLVWYLRHQFFVILVVVKNLSTKC